MTVLPAGRRSQDGADLATSAGLVSRRAPVVALSALVTVAPNLRCPASQLVDFRKDGRGLDGEQGAGGQRLTHR